MEKEREAIKFPINELEIISLEEMKRILGDNI